MRFLTFLLVVLLDCGFFAVPVLVYRFAIRKGNPIHDNKKAFFINLAFFCTGTVALVMFNALCGAPLSSKAKFCTECGEKYVPHPVVKTMTCPNCGKTIETTNFCPECGNKISTDLHQHTFSESKSTSGMYVDSLGRIQSKNGSQSHADNETDDSGDVTRAVFIFVFMVVVVFAVIIALCIWFFD